MAISILGLLQHRDGSEYSHPTSPFDTGFILRQARLYEGYGYDRVLIGQNAYAPDPLAIAAFVAANTDTLKFMIAHRPGFVAPTMAARMFATLDQMSSGRCAAHLISAGNDKETQCDGDFLTKEQRYARSLEYVGILRRVWDSTAPIDHDGQFYAFRQAFCPVKPTRPIPIFWGGSSDPAIAAGAQCADIYAFGGGAQRDIAALVARVRMAAACHHRRPTFCMSMRIIMADSEAAAWRRADEIRDAIGAFRAAGGSIGRDKGEVGTRALTAAAASDRQDSCLWNGLTAAVQGRTHATALVGTPDQLTETLLAYHQIGIRHFILTGFEPLADSRAIGEALIPRLRRAAPPTQTLEEATS